MPFHPGCRVEVKEFRAFTKQVWAPSRWARGAPKPAAFRGYRHKLECAGGPGHRRQFKNIWEHARERYNEHRKVMLFRVRVTPFYCSDAEMTFDGGWYAIPCVNVNAESGGRGGWTCNTYGIIDGTWGAYGGYEFGPSACSSSERSQSIVARRIYRDVGAAAWTPFE